MMATWRKGENKLRNSFIFAGLAIMLMTSQAFASGPPAPVAKTGITTLTTAGDDGDFQKGVTWANPRFVDNGDGTVTDKLTSLVWMKHTTCWGNIRYVDARRKIEEANRPGSATACGDYAGGRSDWRIPNVRELMSLVDISNAGSLITPSGAPFTALTSSSYWSSTSRSNNLRYKWTVYFQSYLPIPYSYYDASDSQNNTSTGYVWVVAGDP